MHMTDPYFNQIALQLMDAPTASETAIADAVRGKPFLVPVGAEFPIVSAKSYVAEFLTDAYQPPIGTHFVPFPVENGICDVVRAVYNVNSNRIRIAQSRYLFSIVVEGVQFAANTSDADRAQAVAVDVLKTPNRVMLKPVGAFGGGVFGVVKPPPSGPIDDEWPHWADELRWWHRNDVVGFITLKATGGPTMAEIGPDEEFNREWF